MTQEIFTWKKLPSNKVGDRTVAEITVKWHCASWKRNERSNAQDTARDTRCFPR